jgi:catechol 2,3-dioxygenase-like lactoylglutathione lyase family enzyme
MKVDRIDHFVLTVHDINATCDFYSRILGMEVVTFSNDRKALQFGQQKINLHQSGQEFEPKALKPTSGSADFCLITDIPLKQVINFIRLSGYEITDAPVKRTGAIGCIESIYLRDPDGNLIEISNY